MEQSNNFSDASTKNSGENIYDKILEELEDFFLCINEPEYRAKQVFQWLYAKGILGFQNMTNLSLSLRQVLQEKFRLNLPTILEVQTDKNDGTKKLLIQLIDSKLIESVIIYEEEKVTLCISSQVGCPVNCKFCLTGIHGFTRNLSQGEIIAQLLLSTKIAAPVRITNIVFMGMGEPFLNYNELARALKIITSGDAFGYSPRRITVSTVGILSGLKKFGSDFPKVNLAVSLNATTDDQRQKIIPVSQKHSLSGLIKACREYPLPLRKRITFEYVLIKDLNDSEKDALRLIKLLKQIRCKINLIPLNDSGLSQFKTPDPRVVEKFQRILIDAGYTVLLRKSKGSNILAACGQLGASRNLFEDMDDEKNRD
ncbi:MAG: 23S rRNA (adenine(2503)-C(2))-methyltransferase [Candidatus Schekmanbacteria bacterium RBG_13_48_7]|uniref:Probable dual-specificity RNA methyltransferase RlmN n=1 Tax=Candidatus Schekmanbacteria bacterium RBG_13_48_7 TaxID=1817878 RepID=A0A1F7RQ88_9BACT|nr:MAG: 23S rRNA (adenine(2503)-C(2))-methyltransferase [Candidatus Schekmanbacteria bacterium RBG_13_48_7]